MEITVKLDQTQTNMVSNILDYWKEHKFSGVTSEDVLKKALINYYDKYFDPNRDNEECQTASLFDVDEKVLLDSLLNIEINKAKKEISLIKHKEDGTWWSDGNRIKTEQAAELLYDNNLYIKMIENIQTKIKGE